MTAEDLQPMLMQTVIGVGYEENSGVMLIILADGSEYYFRDVYVCDKENCQTVCH